MSNGIVFEADLVTLVGGGTLFEGDLAAARALAPCALAADSGADALLAAGVMPERVIGDMDSVSRTARATIPPQNLCRVEEQDSTDFEKALARIRAKVILGVGFTGARLDHGVAALHALLRFAHQPVVLLADTELILLAPPRLALTLPQDTVVSLFPLVPVTGRSEGLHWPINGLTFAAGQTIGTSNKASGGQMVLEMDQPGAVLFLPKSHLAHVTQALLSDAPKPARWPARAQQYKDPLQ